MTRRVLIVSPHFPPVNAPDMQRARQALPYLAGYGWDAEVLCVDPAAVDAPRDPLLAEALPTTVPIHRVPAMSPRLGRLFGRGTLARRALAPLGRAGDALLATRKFDLVFFSTTQFSVLRLGARWRDLHGVPYVVDWQDPWVTDYYSRPGAPRPPGGWRYRWSQAEARRHEGPCLNAASGWVGTSQSYQRDLAQRYPWFDQRPQAVIPFGFEEQDFAIAARADLPAAFKRVAGVRHIAFVGAAGPIMEPALRALFSVTNEARSLHRELQLRFHFIGTSYAPQGRAIPTVRPLASQLGLGDCVEEIPERIGYVASLQALKAADALLLLGSADAGYNPSKIATLLHARKPILAVVVSDTLAGRLGRIPSITVAQVGAPETPQRIIDFLTTPRSVDPVPRALLEEISAAGRTRELATLFDRARQYFDSRVS